MRTLYTWKDVEVRIEKERSRWPESWKKVRVYHDEIIVLKTDITKDEECDKTFFRQVFGSFFDAENYAVHIDEFEIFLPIVCEEDDFQSYLTEVLPLFRSIYFNSTIEIPKGKQKLPGKPVIAFHSYKGGVGRTLVLTSLLKEISSFYGNEKKVLVIDSDLEAPGLTWTIEKSRQFPVSYLDFLSIIRAYGGSKKIIGKIAELMSGNVFYVETEKERVRHYFLPAYLDDSQLLVEYARPEHILDVSEERFLISESISLLGSVLEADLVLIDLRAGISEISAPLLFDSRVSKYFVSSTSLQSIVGTRMIQEQVYQKSKLSLSHSKIVMNMIPPEMTLDIKTQKIDELVEIPEKYFDNTKATFLRDEYVIDIDFEQQLLNQGRFEEVCAVLSGTNMGQKMNRMAQEVFDLEPGVGTAKKRFGLNESVVRKRLKQLNLMAGITAEASNTSEMLLTDSLLEIVKCNRKAVPNIVVLGAKGSGKTYLYRRLVDAKKWGNLVLSIEENKQIQDYVDAVFVPVLGTANDKNMSLAVKDCFSAVNEYFGMEMVNQEAFGNFRASIGELLEKYKTSAEWAIVWKEQILKMFDGRFHDLRELNAYLEKCDKNIVLLIDGLDDLQNYEQGQAQNYLAAVHALCQTVIKEIEYLNHRHIGLLVFLRRDIAEEAIQSNFRQFIDQYGRYELNWSQTEALRLALWISKKAIPELEAEGKILLLSREEIEKRLEPLWGKKLGKDTSKEANSARWILAALSDFNGQLQARDIVRFLKYASQDSESVSLPLKDRYIMPKKIRDAIEPCAKDKLEEMKQEMPKIYNILQKFNNKEITVRQLPLELEKISLSVDELDRLERQGFIKVSEKQYYLPEIIRRALGYRYKVGARPKVLSLLIK